MRLLRKLVTDRLILREWSMDDLNDFYEYCSSPIVGPNAGWMPHTDMKISEEILENFIEDDETWAIVYKENNKVIGSVGLHEDEKRVSVNAKMIGYVLSDEYWGRGIMTEAVKEVIKFAFEDEDMDILTVYHYPFNKRSENVIKKCGFTYEGVLRKASTIFDGSIQDNVCYSMLREEYEKIYK